MKTRDRFKKACEAYIKEIWIRRVNPFDNKPSFPARVTDFVQVKIVGGKSTLFRIDIKPFMKKAKTVLLLSLFIVVQAFAESIEVDSWDGICPLCKKHGKKSTITMDGYSTSTLLASQGRYDEKGNYHHEDPNTTSTGGMCSNGHNIGISTCRGKTTVRAWKEKSKEDLDKNLITYTNSLTMPTPKEGASVLTIHSATNQNLITVSNDEGTNVATIDQKGVLRCKDVIIDGLVGYRFFFHCVALSFIALTTLFLISILKRSR